VKIILVEKAPQRGTAGKPDNIKINLKAISCESDERHVNCV
jgi:hypothetical protein